MGPRRLQVRALWLVARAAVSLRRVGVSGALQRLCPREPPRERAVDERAACDAVRRAGRLLGVACLGRSVALVALLERSGRPATLVLGCRRYPDRTWGSHAWVDRDGSVLEPLVAPEHAELARCARQDRWMVSAGP